MFKPVISCCFLLCLLPMIYTENELEAASHAKWIVQNTVNAALSTVASSWYDFPFVTMEDVCLGYKDEGTPVLVLANISTSSQNLYKVPTATLGYNYPNCSKRNWDSMPYDQLACPRVTLFVDIFGPELLTSNTTNPNYPGFLICHPALSNWIDGPHFFYLWNIIIIDIHYVGGYGNLHYIGYLNLTNYYNVEPTPPT